MATWMPTTHRFSSNFKYYSMPTRHWDLFSFHLETAKIGPDLRCLLSKALPLKCGGDLFITYMLTKFGDNTLLQLQPDITTSKGKIQDSRYPGCV